MHHYLFLQLSVFLLAVWFLIYLVIKNPTLKRKMVLSSVLLTPVGLSDYFYNPQYWHPEVIFSFHRMNFGALIFSFSVGGIAAVSYELF